MARRIEQQEEILAYSDTENPWLKLFFDRVSFPDGKQGRYNRVVENNGKKGVAVIPIKRSGDTLIGLVNQFRYPIGDFQIEIPRGFSKTENTWQEAIRELTEETGINSDEVEIFRLGHIYPNSGVLSTKVELFAADYKKHDPAAYINKEESFSFDWFSRDNIMNMIQEDKIMDAFTLSSILKLQIASFI